MTNNVTNEKAQQSVVTKMRYEDPVKGNKILINKSVCNKKKLDHVLLMLY